MARSARALPPLVHALLVLVPLVLGGCLMPTRGTPVFVDANAGNFWTGEGVLLEVSEDRQRCRVAVRNRALVVRNLWVECIRVHPRRAS